MDIELIRKPISANFSELNSFIKQQIECTVPIISELANYLIGSGGKRIRSSLCLLYAKALGVQDKDAMLLAAAIEFIHAATLLHDDIVDDSAQRRGKQSAHLIYGNDVSILVGDFLYTRAFQLLVQLQNHNLMELMANITNSIAMGEVKQLVNKRHLELSVDEYLEVITCKTAMLFIAATEGSAYLKGLSKGEAANAAEIGLAVGISYQLIDDLLDYCGDPNVTGKNILSDLTEGKVTLPLMLLYQEASAQQKLLIEAVVRNPEQHMVDEVGMLVRGSKVRDKIVDLVNNYHKNALANIQKLPDSEYRVGLAKLISMLSTRDY